jgi:hypothetical protein
MRWKSTGFEHRPQNSERVTLKRATVQEGLHRLSVAHLLTAIVVLFVVEPFVDRWRYGDVVESVLFTLVMLAAVSAIGGRRTTLIVAAILAAPALITRWLTHIWPDLFPHDLHLVVAILFVGFVIYHLFRFVISAPAVNAEVLCSAISIYLLFAVAWSFAYTVLARADPNAFTYSNPADEKSGLSGFTALYFSVQILTTITFGDIMPASNVARMMSLVEASAGVFYLAILIARLVGLYSSGGASTDA